MLKHRDRMSSDTEVFDESDRPRLPNKPSPELQIRQGCHAFTIHLPYIYTFYYTILHFTIHLSSIVPNKNTFVPNSSIDPVYIYIYIYTYVYIYINVDKCGYGLEVHIHAYAHILTHSLTCLFIYSLTDLFYYNKNASELL